MLINLQIRERERERERERAAAAAHSFTRYWNHDGDFLGLAKRNKPSTSNLYLQGWRISKQQA
jgi:hypothetical protein